MFTDMKTGVVSQAKGSAYIEYRNTKVICSAFDPREIPNRSEFCINGELFVDFRFATFANKRRSTFRRDAEEVELSVCLKRALEPSVCRVCCSLDYYIIIGVAYLFYFFYKIISEVEIML